MRVSVVICAYTLDRWDALKAAVQSCVEQTLEPIEVIVVIDYNDELFGRASLEFLNARVVANRMTKGLSGARNTGVLVSSGDTIAFLDDDAFAEHDWLQELVAPMNDPTVAGTGGWIVPHWESEKPPWFPETFYWILGCSYSGLPPSNSSIRNPIGANMAIRREVFAQVGGFTSGIGRIGVIPLGCEETELCIRYTANNPGERFLLTREAVVHHRVPVLRLTWHYFWTRCWAEGLSKAAVSTLVGSDLSLAAERRHVLTALPRELARSLVAMKQSPRAGATRFALVVAGSGVATAGLVRGRIALVRNPIEMTGDQLGPLTPESVKAEPPEAPRPTPRTPFTPFGWRGAPKEARNDLAGTSVHPWRPVEQIRFDVDAPSETLRLPAEPGERVWIEVFKRGQVIGVIEAYGGDVARADSIKSELASAFADIEPSPFRSVPDELLPSVTVVVPTICRQPAQLVRTVESLLALDYPDFEIIVVDNRTGFHNEPLPAFPGGDKVRVELEAKPGIAAARNRGVASAKGEVIAFTDDDVLVDVLWRHALGARFALDPEVEGVGGLVLPSELATEPQLWFEEFYGGFSQSFRSKTMSVARNSKTDELFPYAPGRFGAGCNMAFRRTTLERVGGFNELLGTGTAAKGGEDLAIFINVLLGGGTLAFEPAALVRHAHRRTESEFMSQVFGYGVGLTAMYTALVVSDPRHLIAMLRRIPAGVRLLTRPSASRSPSSTTGYPRRTYGNQMLGMAYGPVAYLRSVIKTR